MDHEAVLTFAYEDGEAPCASERASGAERARRIERSVRPESGEIAGDRTRTSVERDGAAVTVTVEAADLVALRAGVNTWSTLVDVAERTDDAGRRRR